MHIGTQSTEQPCLLAPSSLQFRTDASVTGHALAPVDSGLLAAQAAIDAGVFGAPSYVIGGEIFWGQDRLDFVQRRLLQR